MLKHALKFPISARHFSMLIGIIPKNEQPSLTNQCNNERKSDNYNS